MKNELRKHKDSDRRRWVVTFVTFLLVIGLAGAAFVLAAKTAGWFEPRRIKTDTEFSVKFSIDTNYDNSTGIKLFYDDQGTEDVSDDTYYRMVRYSQTTEGHPNYQKDGFLIMDEHGKWYALGACDLSETVTVRIKSTYDTKDASRETQIYVDGKLITLKAEATLTKESLFVVEGTNMTDTRETCPGGVGVRVDGADGIVYYIED